MDNKIMVEYRSNNSGGSWWLDDKDWMALEKAWWYVYWWWYCNSYNNRRYNSVEEVWNNRYLGALATSAIIKCSTIEEAIEIFENVTWHYNGERWCSCCWKPHSFYVVNNL